MKKTTFRMGAISSAIFIAVFVISGCATATKTEKSETSDSSGAMDHGNNSEVFSGSDIMFAQMMIPHHQQAVDMGTLAETRALSSDVKELAAKIKAEQAPEIEQMKSWLVAARASITMDHEMDMDGMLSASEMSALVKAKGAKFDRLYLEGMIAHHKGAIQMARTVIDSENPAVKALAKAIIDSQAKEITSMETLLTK